jgi:similar to spore coat protein
LNQFLQNMAGMGGMTNQVIATDFLFAVKSDIKMLAAAIAESHTPEVRETLTQYLNDSIDKHQEITDYMVTNGFYYPNDLAKQLGVDLQAAQTAANLGQNQGQNQGQNSMGQNQGQNQEQISMGQNQGQNQEQISMGQNQGQNQDQISMGQNQGQNQDQISMGQNQDQSQGLVQNQNQNQNHYHNQVVAQHQDPNSYQNFQ